MLVDRGWVAGWRDPRRIARRSRRPRARERAGRINIPPPRYIELKHDTPVGPVWQNLDPQRFARATGVRVPPIVVEQTAPRDSADTLVRDWPRPDLGVERHRIYMFQWYTFAAMAAGLWLFFTLRRRDERRSDRSKPRGRIASRRTLVLIALVAVAPVIASYAVYYFFPRTTLANYGELLPTRPRRHHRQRGGWQAVPARRPAGKMGAGVAAGGACDAACTEALYATRQARTLQGREMDRITRVWFVTDDAEAAAGLAAQHPDLLSCASRPPGSPHGRRTPNASISSIRSAISSSRFPAIRTSSAWATT